MSKVKNDRDFPVVVTYTKDGEEVTETYKPGDTFDVSKDQLEKVEKLIAEAPAPEPVQGRPAEGTPQAQSPQNNVDDEANTQHAQLSETQALERRLSAAEAKLRGKEIDEAYDTALRAGKVVPAQKDAFYALSEALHGQTRNLSDGKTQSLSEVLADFVAKAPKVVSLDEETGKITDDTDKSPVDKLPEESKRGLAEMDVSAGDYAKYGAKQGVSINSL